MNETDKNQNGSCQVAGGCSSASSCSSAAGCDSATAAACGSGAAPDALAAYTEEQKLQDRLAKIRHKVLVMSGKGGVGKSTVAVNLAASLLRAGKTVGLMDADMHGPSVPKMLGSSETGLHISDGTIFPTEIDGIKVMSVAFLLDNADDPLIWRGPLKMSVIKQFLADVDWGELDYLVIDLPPGTGDEPLSVCQLIGKADGAVVVTTPQDVALAAVRKSITFCNKIALPVLGVVENMSGFVCPHCNHETEVFKRGGGETMAADMGVPFLGRIPIEPMIGLTSDAGTPFVLSNRHTASAKAFAEITAPILALDDGAVAESDSATSAAECQPESCGSAATCEHAASCGAVVAAAPELPAEGTWRFAVPLAEGKLCNHFGHCEMFALVDVDAATCGILKSTAVTPPPHEPGVLPRWLGELGVTTIIAGGMGASARGLFDERGIEVVTGAPVGTPEELVIARLTGTLKTGENTCDH